MREYKPTLWVLILLLQPALIVCGGAWANAQIEANPFGFSLDSDLEMLQAGQRTSMLKARQLQERLHRNPEDIKTRALLSAYYFRHAMRRQRLENVFWLIDHHPESELLQCRAFAISAEDSPINDMASYERAKALWLSISQKAHQNPEILWNAGSFIIQFDPSRTEQLTLAGKAVEPNNQRWNERLAFLYSKAVFTGGRMRPEMPATPERDAFAQKARRELEKSSDPDLLGIAGNSLAPADPQVRAMRPPEAVSFGLELLKRARQLAPNDGRWDSYLEAFSEAPKKYTREPQAQERDLTLNKRKNVEPGTLLRRVEPEYPDAALGAGLQGTVRLRILIGTDGHVLNAWLISGEPLLYASAYRAVRLWLFEPLRIANDPVEAYHVLELQFRLPASEPKRAREADFACRRDVAAKAAKPLKQFSCNPLENQPRRGQTSERTPRAQSGAPRQPSENRAASVG
jgi:TonB family protein